MCMTCSVCLLTIAFIILQRDSLKQKKIKTPQLFSPLRYLLTGQTAGIGVPVIASLLGKRTTLQRLQQPVV